MSKNKSSLVSIIAPAYNEEKILSSFINEVTRYLNKKYNYELIIVDNGSEDKTLKIAKEHEERNKSIKVFHLPKPGYGIAAVYGFNKASGDYVVFFNIDFWDPKFLEITKVDLLGYDIIIGSKNLPGSEDERSLLRRAITKSYCWLLRLVFGYKGTDTHGIKVYRSDTAKKVFQKCQTRTGIFDTEIMIRSQRRGLKILELPVKVTEIRPTRFKNRAFKTFGDIWQLYQALKTK